MSHDEHEDGRIDALLKAGIPGPLVEQLASASLDTTPQAPKVGQRVNIAGAIGIVCAPNDPGRTGTYKSKKFGDIPIRMLGNRKQRRADAAKRGR